MNLTLNVSEDTGTFVNVKAIKMADGSCENVNVSDVQPPELDEILDISKSTTTRRRSMFM